jgi:Uma2 family endonuclease
MPFLVSRAAGYLKRHLASAAPVVCRGKNPGAASACVCYVCTMNAPTWEDILADRSLRDLPYKIETNRYHKIIMSPTSYWHSNYQTEIATLLLRHMGGGRAPVECAVRTSEGIRVADVAWISLERQAPHKRATALPIAPEICVEVLSPSNTREEMLEKMTLYYAKGAREVWLCNENGHMEFFTAESAPASVEISVLCPAFPRQIDMD